VYLWINYALLFVFGNLFDLLLNFGEDEHTISWTAYFAECLEEEIGVAIYKESRNMWFNTLDNDVYILFAAFIDIFLHTSGTVLTLQVIMQG
jgi:hypothetical protein